MAHSAVDLRLIFIALIAINIVTLYFVKSTYKYLFVPTIILALSLIIFTTYITYIFPTENEKIEQRIISINKEGETYPNGYSNLKWNQLKADKAKLYSFNRPSWELLGQQILITFVLQIIGYKKSDKKKIYKWTSVIFGILTIAYLFFELLIGIVPTTGMLG